MKVDAGSGGKFEIPEAGSCACRAIRVVDLGTQENEWKGEVKMQHQVCLTWELAELMEDERPFVVQKIFTASIGDKSNLGKLLNSWRGRPFTDDEKAGFELTNILGVPGLMSVEHHTKTSGDVKPVVGNIIPLPKGMTAPEQYNESFTFEIDEIDDQNKLKQLWGLERFMIEKSEEFKLSDATMPEREEKKESSKTESNAGQGDEDPEAPF